MWGALLVAFFIFALAYIFVFTGMANSLAYGLSKIGVFFVVLAPILGWIGVALSGSNTATNAMFGPVQALTGRLLNLPVLLLPSFNSVGAEVGKPIAPQTASVGVSTSKLVRSEGQVIRHNMGWTLVVLAYLILISVVFYFFFPSWMTPYAGDQRSRLRALLRNSRDRRIRERAEFPEDVVRGHLCGIAFIRQPGNLHVGQPPIPLHRSRGHYLAPDRAV